MSKIKDNFFEEINNNKKLKEPKVKIPKQDFPPPKKGDFIYEDGRFRRK